MPKIPTIADCTFHSLAIGLISCKFEAVSGGGANRPEAYRNLLDNFYDAHCEKLDNEGRITLYQRLHDARLGVW